MTLLYILISLLIISAVSLIGALYFAFSEKALNKSMPWLVAFAAGALLGVGLLDLIPEGITAIGNIALYYTAGGIILFLLFEQVLHWHHEHHHNCDECGNKKVIGYSVLVGDAFHNFLDGVIVASAFLVSIPVGIATTFAMLLHEIPQELGDFAVLIHSGFTKTRALWWNLLSALVAVIGGLVAYFALQSIQQVVPYIIAVGAGGFIYIALVDLFAELKTGKYLLARFGQVAVLILGIIAMLLVKA
ncbi:ZIP family metal transporter [Patescibacteria group bacterium]|nr:ZIP family metal transporter [Patescibacteria group bacterium]